MSASFEETVSKTTFDAFAIDATLDSVPIKTIVDMNVEVVDSDGNVRRHTALAHFWKATMPTWAANDKLITAKGSYRLEQLEIDDGYIQKISVRPV